MKLMRRLAAMALLVALGLAALPAVVSAQSATGSTLVGRVVDSKKEALPGVTINATEKDTGFNRTTVTASDGAFRLPSLPVGTYKISAELAGFATVNVDEVRLTVATERKLEITMNSAKVEESITVVDEAPLVSNSPAIGTVVSQNELENLPLNGRQFANLATLAPGTSLGVNGDPTKPGQQVVQLNGGTGRNVNYLIDGGDNTDDTIGGALQNFNLESVKEFKIQTMQYKAEYGRSSGGILSVVTKTGTNSFEGSAYGFRRDKSLNTETETERQAGIGKQPFKRDQYGASFGGPIVKDVAHFFATWEKTKRDTSYTINTKGVLPNDGTSVAIPFTDELGTAKVSWDFSSKQYLQVRYGYQKNADKYGASPIADPSSLGTITNDYKSLLVGHNVQLGAESLNEALFQYTRFKNSITADSNDPALLFPSGVTVGQNVNTPQTTEQTKYQYKDDFSFSTTLGDKRHDFKVGVNYINEPTLGGDFSTGLSGQYTLLTNSVNSPVTDITIFGGFAGYSTPIKEYSVYAQDDWVVSNNFTINLGLRYDYWDGFNIDQRDNPIWQTLSTQTQYNESYLRDFQGGKGGVLKNDKKDIGPRAGFTWDLRGDGKHLLRGGWGRYYDFPYTNATILFPSVAIQSTYGVIYNNTDKNGIKNSDGTFFHPGQTLPANQVPPGVAAPNEVASPTLATPRSDQASLGYSFEVNNWLGFNLEAVDIRTEHIPFRFRANPLVPGTNDRRFPDFGNFRVWYGNGSTKYDGVNLGVHARLTNFELQGFYTYSETTGNVLAGTDEFRLTDAGHQPDLVGGTRRDVSVDPLNPLCSACFGPLNTDARHRVTRAGTYRAPFGINASGVFRYHSSQPYTVQDGADLNGDGYAVDLAPGVAHVNSLRLGSFEQLDLRLSKEFRFGGNYSVELIGEVFNVFNAKNAVKYNGTKFNYIPDPNDPTHTKTIQVPNPDFGKPTAFAGDPLQGEQRLAQIGLRFHF
jgi:hypothetical protein